MSTRLSGIALLVLALSAAVAQAASPLYTTPNRWVSSRYPWHGAYYDPAWGEGPTALVVPPTAHLQTKWAWGVTNTEVVRNYHQFGRRYPGFYTGGYGFVPTPHIPGHTDEFGVYYVRGPW